MRKILFAFAALLGICGSAHAQSVERICVPVYDPNSGAIACQDSWTTKLLSGLSNTPIVLKSTRGQLGKIYCYNPNASVAYLQIFNTASPTVGTTAPAQSYGIPATSANGFSVVMGDLYTTAISVAATTTATGGTAPGTALDCNASYN